MRIGWAIEAIIDDTIEEYFDDYNILIVLEPEEMIPEETKHQLFRSVL